MFALAVCCNRTDKVERYVMFVESDRMSGINHIQQSF